MLITIYIGYKVKMIHLFRPITHTFVCIRCIFLIGDEN